MKKSQKRDIVDQLFDPKHFIKTLSYREFITSLSLALLLVASAELLDYYSDEHWIENNQSWIKFLLFFTIFLGNHIFYYIEHKRQNNFIGRNLHDYIFMLLFVAVSKLHIFLTGGGFRFDIGEIGSLIVYLFLFIIVIMFFELAVALLKRGLKLLRWRVL